MTKGKQFRFPNIAFHEFRWIYLLIHHPRLHHSAVLPNLCQWQKPQCQYANSEIMDEKCWLSAGLTETKSISSVNYKAIVNVIGSSRHTLVFKTWSNQYTAVKTRTN